MVHLMALVIGNYTKEMNTSCTTYSPKHLIGRLQRAKFCPLAEAQFLLTRKAITDSSSGHPLLRILDRNNIYHQTQTG